MFNAYKLDLVKSYSKYILLIEDSFWESYVHSGKTFDLTGKTKFYRLSFFKYVIYFKL